RDLERRTRRSIFLFEHDGSNAMLPGPKGSGSLIRGRGKAPKAWRGGAPGLMNSRMPFRSGFAFGAMRPGITLD
ncbi:hypothetical protein, partial [Mesorhizobium sp. M7A.F.Ca.CA.002.07.1.1]|uniref:hypothetical protein n=1 Tax=Mesorhizobium sp. M7A.F.Ca.CA.002.07.1.1 TaxID=2496723 RepID=UPI0019D2221A